MQLLWITTFSTVLLWSAIQPKDYFIWTLEVLPALIGFAVIVATRKSFPLTRLCYGLILLHCIILMVGGHYTYEAVPLFDWIKDALQLPRNNFDKLGHFAQGFVPAIIAREVLLRKRVVAAGPPWLNFIIVCFCLALSACYELLEWAVAVLSGDSADAFLGTQGYVWDTQSDMAMALAGSLIALATLSSVHDRPLARISHQMNESSLDP
jgi:putative membrane protein